MANGGDTAEQRSEVRPPLTKEAIVGKAIDIADAEGVGKLSMRHLARSLGYEVMSLYNHVANKSELLSQMLDTIAADIEDPDNARPMEAIRTMAIATRDTFLEHRWAPDLWLQHLPGPERTRTMETLLRLLDDSGLEPDLAHFGFHAVNNHVIGYTLQQFGMTVGLENPEQVIANFLDTLSEGEHPQMIKHIHQHMAGEEGESFELALDLILDGLVRLNDERS